MKCKNLTNSKYTNIQNYKMKKEIAELTNEVMASGDIELGLLLAKLAGIK